MKYLALVIAAAGVIAAQTSVGSNSQAAAARPDASRFTPVTVVQPGELDEPMSFEVLPGGKVYIIERKGALKAYDPATNTWAARASMSLPRQMPLVATVNVPR